MSKITQQFTCVLAALLIAFGLPSKADVKTHVPAITAKVKKKQKHHLDVRKIIVRPLALVEPLLTGIASWYGPGFQGSRTSSGKRFDTYKHMCAMRYVPFHTWVIIKNLNNGLKTRCKIEDRGPFVPGRVIDLSYAAKQDLQMGGTAPVAIYAIH